jgi:hypothetical protein
MDRRLKCGVKLRGIDRLFSLELWGYFLKRKLTTLWGRRSVEVFGDFVCKGLSPALTYGDAARRPGRRRYRARLFSVCLFAKFFPWRELQISHFPAQFDD